MKYLSLLLAVVSIVALGTLSACNSNPVKVGDCFVINRVDDAGVWIQVVALDKSSIIIKNLWNGKYLLTPTEDLNNPKKNQFKVSCEQLELLKELSLQHVNKK